MSDANKSADVNMWNMCIHLTQFCGYLVPMAVPEVFPLYFSALLG